MSNSKISAKELEELKKLENEAIIELYQIIAIAYQIQDIEYINNMISVWKTKYKKILDNPSPDLKKKIKQLLDEAYSEVVKYILSQIKLKEERAIKNQRKALNELYRIISDNYDYDTVINSIKKWENKYPYDSFLKMYQKRIDSAKRTKNIEDHAFKQEEAFKDLYYGVVNRSGTIKELKEYLHKWEQKYYINNKFTIDHFIKHQSEVKRYVSDDFLISIAKKDYGILDTTESKITDSSLASQDASYKHLISIINKKNNIDEVFKWVYENNSIKFNDKYKELILSATYLDYSPKYLNTLPVPDIDLTKPVLSIEQYNKIDEIKRYAVISYFNLLLPTSKAISNNYFTKHIKTIYYECERKKHSNIINTFKDEVTTFAHEIPKEEKETDLKLDSTEIEVLDDKNSFNANETILESTISEDIIEFTVPTTEETEYVNDTKNEPDTIESITYSSSEIKESDEEIIAISDTKNNVIDIETLISSAEEHHTIEVIACPKIEEPIIEDSATPKPEAKEHTIVEPSASEAKNISVYTESIDNYEVKTTNSIISQTTDIGIESTEYDMNSVTISSIESDLSGEPIVSESITEPDISYNSVNNHSTEKEPEQNIDYNTMVSFSPSFFEIINNYSIQANLVQAASKTAQKINTTTPIAIDKSDNKTRNQSE